jgi:hypothetical protein
MAVICALPGGAAAHTVAFLAAVGRGAVASPTPTTMNLACMLKSNGLMRYVTSTNQVKGRKTRSRSSLVPSTPVSNQTVP